MPHVKALLARAVGSGPASCHQSCREKAVKSALTHCHATNKSTKVTACLLEIVNDTDSRHVVDETVEGLIIKDVIPRIVAAIAKDASHA